MDYNNLKQLFETNQKLHFKLYSLEYIVETSDNRIVIYAILCKERFSLKKVIYDILICCIWS